MADFAVDYALLQQVEDTLNRLKSGFDNLGALQHAADWGHGDIASAMADFADNWSYHRQRVVDSMGAMAKNAHDTRTQTDQYDTTMKQQVTGH